MMRTSEITGGPGRATWNSDHLLIKRLALRVLTSIFGMFLFVALPGVVMAQTIVDDIKLIRKNNKHATIDINNVVMKHIPIGIAVEDAMKILKLQQFEVHKPESVNLPDETFIGIHRMTAFGFSGFKDEIRVVVTIRNGRVASITGKLIYRSL